MSRDLNDLHPIVRMKAAIFLRLCEESGVKVSIYFTYRSNEEQDALYAQGRRGIPGEEIVTKAKGGDSGHNYRASFDCVPIKDRKPWWDAPDSVWLKIAKCAENVGLDSYIDKWGEYLPWDKGHMTEPGWKHIKTYLLENN